MLLFNKNILRLVIKNNILKGRYVSYEQGQRSSNIREYFYYIDHQGMLFLDDSRMKNFTSCFKDKKFLHFFFTRLRQNNTDNYKDFPYISLCGKERNYVRCDDLPIVFTHILSSHVDSGKKVFQFSYAHTGPLLTEKFQPDKLYMSIETGRVYHPASKNSGSVGLVRSKLAIELSKFFEFRNGEHKSPTHFMWDGTLYELDTEWYEKLTGKA